MNEALVFECIQGAGRGVDESLTPFLIFGTCTGHHDEAEYIGSTIQPMPAGFGTVHFNLPRCAWLHSACQSPQSDAIPNVPEEQRSVC